MSLSITIQSINFSGENANVLFKPDNYANTINLGNVILPFEFYPNFLTPPQEIYGVYTILTQNGTCPNILNVPRPTQTPTPTITPTRTPTPTPTSTPTPTPTNDPCPTKTPTPTPTKTPLPTKTPTRTPTPTPTTSQCKTPTPTPTPTKTPTAAPSGIYFGKFTGTTISSGDIGSLTFVQTNNPTNTYVSFGLGTAYGYILIPTSLPQPSEFRDSNNGCTGNNIPINNIGNVIIIDINGFAINYNIYRTFYNFYGNTECWMCA